MEKSTKRKVEYYNTIQYNTGALENYVSNSTIIFHVAKSSNLAKYQKVYSNRSAKGNAKV